MEGKPDDLNSCNSACSISIENKMMSPLVWFDNALVSANKNSRQASQTLGGGFCSQVFWLRGSVL